MRLCKAAIIGSSIGIALLLAACSINPLAVPVDAVTTVAEDRRVSDAGTDLRIKTEILKELSPIKASVDKFREDTHKSGLEAWVKVQQSAGKISPAEMDTGSWPNRSSAPPPRFDADASPSFVSSRCSGISDRNREGGLNF